MINVHLNGDVVRCPDQRAIMLRIEQRNDKERRCKYGIEEHKCEKWKQFVLTQPEVKNFSSFGRCVFAYSESCPMHIKRVEQGNTKKKFKIDGVTYRKMASSAIYLYNESKFKTLFLTLTFPPFRGKHNYTKSLFENEVLNIYFSRFVENLRENYDCMGYVAVRERGEIGNRIHFHLLLSIPFVPFADLNNTWCNTIKNICYYSANALTSDPKTVRIKENPVRAIKYICKYFSKCKGQESDSRIVFISNNIIQKSKSIRGKSIESVLGNYKFDYYKPTSDYTTVFRITDNAEFNRFFKDFLHPFFELSVKKDRELYSFPINTS
jgi:hypothetical protein